MLVVKAFDMLHSQAMARKEGHGSNGWASIGALVAIAGAIFLFMMAEGQVAQMPSMPDLGNY